MKIQIFLKKENYDSTVPVPYDCSKTYFLHNEFYIYVRYVPWNDIDN